MFQSQARQEDFRLGADRHVKYKGTARVRLEHLHFRWNEPRELDQKNVARLKECFRKEGCLRIQLENHIPAVIDQQLLDSAAKASGLTIETLRDLVDYPDLQLPEGYQLECLHGRHRVQAGREYLAPQEKWWTVDLYLADVSHDLKLSLIEEYSNQQKPSDGEIYCKIRLYHYQRVISLEKRWWARLTPHRRKNLKRLFQHDELTAAFDALLDVPGLWGGMRISTLHKVMTMRCDEEILHYLGHVKEFWHKLLQGDKLAMSKVDQATVKGLELRAPRASTRDALAVRGRILGGEIFGAFSEAARVEIWARLQTLDYLIPSLFTFFEDVKYLELCANCVKWLLTVSPRDTVLAALQRTFSDTNQKPRRAMIQVTESDFIYRPANIADQVELGCRQLYLYAMRHFPSMPNELKGKDFLAKPTGEVDRRVLCEFAHLASRLGFVSPKIETLKANPNSTPSRAESRPPKTFLVTDGPGESINRRCGIPTTQAFKDDRAFLFIDRLHGEVTPRGEGITSLFVRVSVYLAFLGKPSWTGMAGVTDCIDPSPHDVQDEEGNTQPSPEHMEEDTEPTEGEPTEGIGTAQELSDEQRIDQEEPRENSNRDTSIPNTHSRLNEESEEDLREEIAEQEHEILEQQSLGEEEIRERPAAGTDKRGSQFDLEVLMADGHGGSEGSQGQTQTNVRKSEQGNAPGTEPIQETADSLKVRFTFKSRSGSFWEDALVLMVDPHDPSEVEHRAKQSMRSRLRLFNKELRMLAPVDCYEVAIGDGTNTIFLIPESEIDIDKDLMASVQSQR